LGGHPARFHPPRDCHVKEKGMHRDSGSHTHGLTSWLKARFLAPRRNGSEEEQELPESLAGLERVGRYEIQGKLGQGSMGVVYLGQDPYIKRKVAIKISRPSMDLQGEMAERYRERFFVEAQSAGKLRHPNIIAIYDAGLDGDLCYTTMEYVDGPTLEAFCRPGHFLPLHQVVRILFVSCKALEYAHRQGVVHRDIKPSNIMMNRSGVVKITDFGIAHVETDKTHELGLIGSPCYMSPEQVREEPVDEKSDIFSLGCVLYELLTGHKAFAGDNYFSILYKITHENPVPLTKLRPDLPAILEKITSKALSKDPAERYQTCLDFAFDLRVALRGLRGSVRNSRVEDVVDYVRQVPFFVDFTREEVKGILLASNLLKVPRGRVVVTEGEIDDSFYIILSGKVSVRIQQADIARIERGECFGEMSYLSGQTRAATVVAATDCILMKISATLLDRASAVIQLKFLKQFAKVLLTRLEKSNRERS